MKKYVVGFLFNNNGQVLLINKNRPDWQKGRLNGIGGHIEKGELPIGAMNREFFEEAGICATWRQFCLIHGSTYELYCFTSRIHTGTPKTMTDEKIGWYPSYELPANIIGNLTWLIPMARYEQTIIADVTHESETA
jgi:8-oxo-dGTP diphosphatase